uniref:RNA-directed DNA polymerase n=1 Tax=Strongyloides venezuelensis TaxID=75913 RepID=A0A0K0FT61_STRVS
MTTRKTRKNPISLPTGLTESQAYQYIQEMAANNDEQSNQLERLQNQIRKLVEERNEHIEQLDQMREMNKTMNEQLATLTQLVQNLSVRRNITDENNEDERASSQSGRDYNVHNLVRRDHNTHNQVQNIAPIIDHHVIEVFNGKNSEIHITKWLKKLEIYFKMNSIPEERKYSILAYHLSFDAFEIIEDYEDDYYLAKNVLIHKFDHDISSITARRQFYEFRKGSIIRTVDELDKAVTQLEKLVNKVFVKEDLSARIQEMHQALLDRLDPRAQIIFKAIPIVYDVKNYEQFIERLKIYLVNDTRKSRDKPKVRTCYTPNCKYWWNHKTEDCKVKNKSKEIKEVNLVNLYDQNNKEKINYDFNDNSKYCIDKSYTNKNTNMYDDESEDNNKHENLIYELVTLNKIEAIAVIDTGSQITAISEEMAEKLHLDLKSIESEEIKLLGRLSTINKIKAKITLKYKNKKVTIQNPYIFQKLNVKHDILIGIKHCKKLGLIIDTDNKKIIVKSETQNPTNDNKSQIDELIKELTKKLLDKHSSIFISSDAQLKPTIVAQPQTFSNKSPNEFPLYNMPIHSQKIAQEIANEWLQAGIIRRDIPKNNILAPSIVVKKKTDGNEENDINNKARLVTDLRKINSITNKIDIISPSIHNLLLTSPRYSFVSNIDLKSAYSQVLLNPVNRQDFGLYIANVPYCYNVLPMGGKNSANLFIQAVHQKFEDFIMEGSLLPYHDDFLIRSVIDPSTILNNETLIEECHKHYNLLDRVFTRMKENNIMASKGKSKLFQEEVNFLSYTLSREGWIPAKKSVLRLTKNYPTNKRKLQKFLYGTNYFRISIPNYSQLTSCLYDLLGTLKSDRLLQPQKCYFGDLSKEYILRTDSSQVGIGGTLSQIFYNPKENKNEELLIGICSIKLPKTLRRRHRTFLELKGIATTLEYFSHILMHCNGIKIITDHRPLIDLQTRTQKPRFVELLSIIYQYPVKSIEYQPGRLNHTPDYLSRLEEDKILKDIDNQQDTGYNNDEYFKALECYIATELQKRKRGRPPKQNNKNENISQVENNLTSNKANIPEEKYERPDTIPSNLLKSFLDLFMLNKDKVRQAQQEDPVCQEAKEKGYFMNYTVKYDKKENLIKVKKNFNIDENTIMKECPDESWKALIPKAIADDVIKMAHRVGHFNYLKTKLTLETIVVIPQIGIHLKNVIDNCEHCKLRNIGKHKVASNRTISIPDAPYDEISIDLICPKTPDTSGKNYKYILAIIDNCTRYIWLIPTKTKNASELTHKLVKHVILPGIIPKTVRTDSEGEFFSDHFHSLLTQIGVQEIIKSTPGNSNSNSLVERTIKTANKVISNLMSQNPLLP